MELHEVWAAVDKRCHHRCEWPRCGSMGEQYAHLQHRGMGGSESANTPDNVMLLCITHHDLLDGRSHAGLRVAIADCLRQTLEYRDYIGRLLRTSKEKA